MWSFRERPGISILFQSLLACIALLPDILSQDHQIEPHFHRKQGEHTIITRFLTPKRRNKKNIMQFYDVLCFFFSPEFLVRLNPNPNLLGRALYGRVTGRLTVAGRRALSGCQVLA